MRATGLSLTVGRGAGTCAKFPKGRHKPARASAVKRAARPVSASDKRVRIM